jgi:peptidyl-tRNA hydrolase, PTH1 family
MRLVVGLGNPGSEFVGTRHNIGWEVVDELALRLGWIGKPDAFENAAKKKFNGLALDGTVSIHSGGTEKVLLLKPLTFMNLSGQSVQAAMAFYQVPPADVMIVLDDLALPCGRLRIRKGGSSGGHNGLKDIERVLASDEYPRLRIGIDPPPPFIPGRDYVLGKFSPEQRKVLTPAIKRAASALLVWIEKGIDAAMNEFNQEEKS